MTTDITFYNGNKMPAVGLGTYRMDDESAEEAVSSALHAGYRLIDTAAFYKNETGVGRGIRKSGLSREEIFLTTKIWNDDLRSGRIREAFRESLDRLGTDYVDLLLVHWPAGEYTRYWQEFEDLYREGAVRNIGVSNFTMRMLDELLGTCSIKPAVNQVERHPYLNQKPLLKYCDNREIAMTAWSGFMVGGILSDPDIQRLAVKYGKTPAQIVQRWNYQNSVATIPKSVNPERQRENIDIFDFSIEFDDLKGIDKLHRNQRRGPNPENFDF